MIKKIYNHFMTDSLYRNSIYLMLSTAVMAFFGFFFWIVNARIFTPSEVGIATTLISISALIANFSLLGLNAGLIRYLPTSQQKNEKINTAFTLVTLAAIVVGIMYLVTMGKFSPKLLFVSHNIIFSLLFILFVVFTSLNTVIESIFIAYRSTKYVFFKNTILSLIKLVLPFLFIALGGYGIFISFGTSIVIACLLSIVFLISNFHYFFKPTINIEVIKQITKFSFGNYVSGFVTLLPMNVLPILITNEIDSGTSAFFYIGMMIANLLYIIPTAASQSLFAEGSYSEEHLRGILKKTIKIIFYLMIPAIIITVIFGNYVLLAFGKQYSNEGFTFLKFLALSGVFISINQLGNALCNVKHKIHYNIILNIVSVVIILGLSYVLISMKLVGVGIAWIVGNGVIALIYLLLIKKYS